MKRFGAIDRALAAAWVLAVMAFAAAVGLRFRDADLIRALGGYSGSLPRPARLFIAGPHVVALMLSLPAAFVLVLVRLRSPLLARALGVVAIGLGLAYGGFALAGQRDVRHLVLGELHRCACESPCIELWCICACDAQGRAAASVSPDGLRRYRYDAAGNLEGIDRESIGDHRVLGVVRCSPPAPPGESCRSAEPP